MFRETRLGGDKRSDAVLICSARSCQVSIVLFARGMIKDVKDMDQVSFPM